MPLTTDSEEPSQLTFEEFGKSGRLANPSNAT
jgi:hypothetical protein